MVNKSNYSIHFSSRADKELKVAYSWYEEQQKDLGNRFINEIGNRIQTIEQNPEIFSVKYKLYREAGLSSFPFLLVYRINKRKRSVKIISVFHTALNSKNKYPVSRIS